ncbi:hypothetical protein [Paraburkholderia sp. MM5477-R1]|uniref:Uncharacterized protein n=1 Tax=Paraburkholderia tuberum TaxID=157910 RepID=A0A1H1KG11_9BURK|nr:hypothetical protein SAMN05445850_7630 [Paraburkholderia tuberum]
MTASGYDGIAMVRGMVERGRQILGQLEKRLERAKEAVRLRHEPQLRPDVVPEIVEADSILRGDHQKLAPFRCYARLWLERDYDAAAGKGEVIVQGDSAVAADRFLHARQTFAQVIGIHDRHEFDLGVQTKEEPLGGIGNLR